MTPQELDALQALCDGATAGPWINSGDILFYHTAPDRSSVLLGDGEGGGAYAATCDLDFIAAARTALPQLIAEVRRLQERCEAAENDIEDVADRHSDPCDYCTRKSCCNHPDSCPDGGYSRFKWRGPQPAKEPDQPNA